MALALIERGSDIDARNNKGKTPLHYAGDNDSEDIAMILIDHGADIHVKDNYYGRLFDHYLDSDIVTARMRVSVVRSYTNI